MSAVFHFHDESALLERLSRGLKKHGREAVFLVGAPMSAPDSPTAPGVPDAEGMIELIRSEFADEPSQLAVLNNVLNGARDRRYQQAFLFLQGRRGQKTANEIVRRAVLASRTPGSGFVGSNLSGFGDDEYRQMDLDVSGWSLRAGTDALGKLVARYPERFGRAVLTTNFDPLVEVAIRRHAGTCSRTVLHSDGNLAQTEVSGCHVIHLHGYWYGSDTLHTARQLGQSRPRLQASLAALLRNRLVVVCAYGGWDDTFTESLMSIVRDDAEYPEILWTFRGQGPSLSDSLATGLAPGIDRGRVDLYSGIDCHYFLPKLYELWTELEPQTGFPQSQQSNPVRVTEELREEFKAVANRQKVLEGDDEDRPPFVEICVGRERELKTVRNSEAKVIFLTGFGGEGKSTVAARYFSEAQLSHLFDVFVWRDCKDERERFENQLASVIERLSGGKISGADLAKQDAASVIGSLMTFVKQTRILFVFDNVDQYVDIEEGLMTGIPDLFIRALLDSNLQSQVVFTCRPEVEYEHTRALSCRLTGIDLDATRQLFTERGAASALDEITDAHRLTNGHAFWLDLLALQVVKRAPATTLSALVSGIRSGQGELPDKTLHSIWSTLKEREQLVLRAMAETVKPETETEIGDYLQREITFNKVMKALRALRVLNLVVVKRRPNSLDLIELHPMVRQFVRQNFTPRERLTFIDAIIHVYQRLIGKHKSELSERPPLSILQYWTQNAELDIEAGKFEEAFLTLAEAAQAFISSAYSREFSRTVRRLLSSVDWVARHAEFSAFDAVFRVHARILGYLGEYSEVEFLLADFERTVPNKDARYIFYCELRCYFNWVKGDFTSAVEWGGKGKRLKDSGVDTTRDVSGSLALAERDAGHAESALQYFLHGRSLDEVTDPEELDEEQDGAHYGNIGRCLHFMGQIDAALVCYQKSALLLERKPSAESVLNQGFARAWIGELLVAREQYRLADVFFRAAYKKWEDVSPPRAANVLKLSTQVITKIRGPHTLEEDDIEKTCLDWILGRNLDHQFR
ncbi:MAG TPA: SIR2 family protein [Candidatus Dormibacteraeota bacterium]|nr:SIR2 family protein [Candidatus Dormibacteraeota bacterium]